ncbi:MAG: hypothetical protein D6834_02025 [Aquificota bacterium]|nr:MAG: hypothetical protein D6834_02025 [Aquificota bacterium]
MKRKLVFLVTTSVLIFSCGEKTSKAPVKSSNKVYQLQKAQANFEELEREAEKKPEELTLPETKEEAIMPTIKKKPQIKREKPIPKVSAKKEVKSKYPLKNGFPIWVYNPNYGGYLGAVGIARKTKRGGYPQQKRVAIMIAQSNLAKQIRILVNAEVYTEKLRISKKDYETYKSKLKSLSKQEASAYLKNTVVKDEWIDPKTGDLYVWVVLEK